MNEDQLIKAIKELVEKGDKAKEKAAQYYTSAGQHLKTLREQAPSKAAWEKLIKSKCGLGTSRAYELMQIADGRRTVAEVRLSTGERVQRHRSRPLRNGQNPPAVAEPVESRERYPRALATTSANQERLNRLAYRLIQNDLETARELYHVLCKADDIQPLILALADGIEVEEKGEPNGGGGMPSAPIVPDDGLDISDYLRRTPKDATAS